MARGKSTAAAKTRNKRVYEDTQAMWNLLGFDTEASWNNWRTSRLVQPRWDMYVSGFLENKAINKGDGRKTGDWDNVFNWIKDGENNGRRRFRSAITNPEYDNAMDWNAWLTFWLVEDNLLDAKGCFYNTKLHTTEMHKRMYYFVIWAKRQRGRTKASKSQKQGATSDATSSRTTTTREERPPINTEDLDPEAGFCMIVWKEGVPRALTRNFAFQNRVPMEGFCGTSKSAFRQYVENGFELKRHRQRISLLYAEDGLSYEEAQVQAHGSPDAVIFILETATSELDADADLQDPPIPNGPDENPEDEIDTRAADYDEMLNEALNAGSGRLDMSVRLWRYNLMLTEARAAGVVLRDLGLIERGETPIKSEEDVDAENAIRYETEVNAHFTAELGHLELLLSDPTELEEGNAPENGPLTRIHNITKEQIAEYRESSKWTDNQAYQPADHEGACRNLGIPNPDKPRLDGMLANVYFDFHQPVCIDALMGFEDSFIGGGILGDDVGLGKTIETIGLLLSRSNQRRDMISRGDTVPKALPTIIIVPQNIVFQWVSEIERFTDRFTIAVYYGAHRNSSNPKIIYVGAKKTQRLTRSHSFFNGNESNSDLIVITSYSTLSARHGPSALWKDTKDIMRRKWNAKRRYALSPKEFAQALTDNEVDKFKVIVDNPNQLHGLFNRVILDEGHTIRNQSKEIGNTITSLGGSYRLIITGTPTVNKLDDYCGLIKFLQNSRVQDEAYLRELGFNDEDFAERPSYIQRYAIKDSPLARVLHWNNPFALPDDDPRAVLRFTSEAAQLHIFVDEQIISMAEQGHLMSKILKHLIVRRTPSSTLGGNTIGAILPSVQRMVFECDFTPLERKHYDAAMADESTKLFAKSKNKDSVEFRTTAFRKQSLLASWIGFNFLLNYKAQKLASLRKDLTAFVMLMDLGRGQERSNIDEGKRIPISEDDKDDVQRILHWHCQGSPKLRKLLELLAEIVVLRKEKAIIWVNNPAQMEWLCQVLSLCGIDARQLRTDLPTKEHDALIHDFDRDPKTASVLICSFLVSCAGLNLQHLCRTSIEFEPPPNESTRQQSLGRVKRRGSLGTWVRHITLLTKNTLNTKQDFDSILNNLPVLVTQLDLKIFGGDNGDEDDGPIEVLGKWVLHESKLYPADHEDVQDLGLEPLSSDNLLLAISLIMAGRKPEGDVKTMRKRLAAGNKAGNFEEFNKLDPLWNSGPEETDGSGDDDLY